eukprot:3206821-Amphidinium_carterae.1
MYRHICDPINVKRNHLSLVLLCALGSLLRKLVKLGTSAVQKTRYWGSERTLPHQPFHVPAVP